MKKAFTLLLFLSSQFSFSQNLVPNWSFEDTVSCPTQYSEISKSVGWSDYDGSPDYFNSCSSLMGVPANGVGFQYARTGSAYGGFITFAKYASNAREVMGIQLIESLAIGQKYFVSFYVSRAFSSSNQTIYYINAASNKIGARFSTVSYYDYSFVNRNPVPIDNHAQVFTDSIITDTLNWVKISGSFVADSSYKYVCFGNFFTDSATKPLFLDTAAADAYYYIDDITVSTDSLMADKEILKNSSVDIFPNPTMNIINIVNNSTDVFNLTVYSVLGKQIFKESINERETSIDLTNYSKGIYFLQIDEKGGMIQKKIVKY